jgi:hypothetical protein
MKSDSALLPSAREGAPSAASHREAEPPVPGQAKILIVDDRPDKLLALEAVLSSLGEHLIKARSGKEALKLSLMHDFAVILLDVSMPVMDGFETAALLRRRPASEHTPIIFVTSRNESENYIAKGYSLGAVDYIVSPIVPGILKSKVSVFVELYKKTAQIREQSEQLRRLEAEKYQRELHEATDRLETETKRNRFFTLAVDMLAIANFDGYMLQLNPAWAQTLGYSEAELKARPGLEFTHPDDRPAMQRELARLQNGVDTTYFEGRYKHKDGSYRWLGWTAASFPSEKLIYIFARDITHRKEAEEEISSLNGQLQRRVADLTEINGELEAFNYSISHDLRAPLRSMQGFARALVEDEGTRLSVEGREFAQRMISSASYMDTLLQDLLEYSRLSRTELNLVPVSVESVLNEVLSHSQKEIAERDAKVEITGPLGTVVAHQTTLNQVLTNLVNNAIKFVGPSRKPVVLVWAKDQPDSVRVFVDDNGIGIDPAYHQKVFGLFERLHNGSTYPGTGVGLAIVRKGVTRMGGSVGVESLPDAGCRFWIELPKNRPHEQK